jgi:hypothetical protein
MSKSKPPISEEPPLGLFSRPSYLSLGDPYEKKGQADVNLIHFFHFFHFFFFFFIDFENSKNVKKKKHFLFILASLQGASDFERGDQGREDFGCLL